MNPRVARRRHYRVARNEIKMPPAIGKFIRKDLRQKFILIGIALSVIMFIKGLIIGLLIGNK